MLHLRLCNRNCEIPINCILADRVSVCWGCKPQCVVDEVPFSEVDSLPIHSKFWHSWFILPIPTKSSISTELMLLVKSRLKCEIKKQKHTVMLPPKTTTSVGPYSSNRPPPLIMSEFMIWGSRASMLTAVGDVSVGLQCNQRKPSTESYDAKVAPVSRWCQCSEFVPSFTSLLLTHDISSPC